MTLIEIILLEASFVEFLILILLLALLKRKKKKSQTSESEIEDEKEKKDYERVKAILEGVQSQKIIQEVEAIPQIQRNLEEIDRIIEEKKEKKGKGFFYWLRRKIRQWKINHEKAKKERMRQEILDQRREELKRKRKEQIRKRITRIKYDERKDKIKDKNAIPLFVKLLIIIIPLILIGYVLYANFVASHSFNYFYDIGGIEDAKKSYLSPANRISDIDTNSSETYRNLTSGLVYFDAVIPRGSDKINVEIKFKNNLSEVASLSIGAKDKPEWHYLYKSIYNPILNKLNDYEYSGNETRIYRINPSMPLIQDLSSIPNNSIIASNIKLDISTNNQSYEIKPLTINTGLRGGHVFYIYLKDSLNLQVKKQDINWYNNSDELLITLYDLNNNMIANTTIPDDGIINVDKKIAQIQNGQLTATNLQPGIYKLEFSNFDGLIREISLNTNKIVTNRLFLADFNDYIKGIEKPSSIYTKANKFSYMEFLTYHKSAFQNIIINSNNLSIKTTNSTNYPIIQGEYTIKSNKNDIIITSPNYLSFSKESYFEPFRYSITPIPNDFNKIKSNYDYVITDYAIVQKQGDWIVSSTSFNLKDLYIKDGKLSMLINTPHLGKEETQDKTIPVDWINITIKKNGIFEN